MSRRTLLLIAACTVLVTVAASSASADPIPISLLTPAPQDFGQVLEGSASASPQSFTIQNTGANPITMNPVALAGNDPGSFTLSGDTCSGVTLNTNDTCGFTVNFTPPVAAGIRNTSQTALIDLGDTNNDDPMELDFSGTPVAPQVGVPANAAFGPVEIGQKLSQIVTVQNTGQGELDVTTPTSPGGDFTVNPTGTTCTGTGAQLGVGGSCNVNVVFTPTSVGDENATLVIATNDPDTPSAQVPLTGTGTQGAVSFTPASGLTFATDVGTTSPSQQVTVTNTGTGPLDIVTAVNNGVVVQGTNKSAFSITGDGCSGVTLQINDSCNVTVAFTATTLAQKTASLQIKDDGTGTPQLLPLTGSGIQSGPVTVSPTSNNFGQVVEGSNSSAQTFTFTNTGGDTVTFPTAPGTFAFTGTNPGDFSISNDGCSGQTIGAGDSCSADVTFSPPTGAGVRGARSATLTVTGGFVNSPLSVKLTGTATAPTISVPGTVNFGNVAVGGTPGQQTVTVANKGAGTLHLQPIGPLTGAGFSVVTDNCSGVALTAPQSCTVVLQFQPGSTGAASGSLEFDSSDPDTPAAVVSLNGTGTQVGPVTVSPTTLTFVSTVEGTVSATKLVTVTNTGTAPLTGLGLALGGSGQSNFTISSDTCTGAQVNPTKTCTFRVAFSPQQSAGVRGAQSATVTVSGPANASGLPQVVSASGTATAPILTIPASYDFGNVPLGQTQTHDITVKNTGTGTLDVTGLKSLPSAGFSITNDGCQAPAGLLAAGQTCTISIAFQATQVGTASGTLTISNNDPDAANPASVALSANGTMAGPVTISPGTKTFSSQVEGTTSATQTFTVTNTGTAPVSLGPAPVVSLGGASPGSFVLSGNTCATTTSLGAEKSCAFKVAFSPPVAAGTRGTQNASVTVTGGADLPQTIPLSGTATAPTLSTSPPSLSFTNTLVGNSSNQTLTVQNTGTGTLSVSNPQASGPFSVVTNGCSAGVSGTKTCAIVVAFSPTAPGGASGTLTFKDTDPDTSGSVSLSGTGTQVGPVTLGGSGSFGSVLEGGSSSPNTFTLKNTGTATLTGITEALSGPNKSSYSIGNNGCGATLAGGANCTFNVTFSPPVAANTRGSQTATLTVNGTNDSADLPKTVSLTGTATAPQIGVPQTVINFGNVPVGTSSPQTIQVTNTAQGSLTVGAVSTMGSGYSVTTNGCAGASLTNGQSCNIKVSYSSTAPGTATGTLEVSSNDPDQSGPTPVTMTANGTQPAVNITGNTAFSTALGTTSAAQAITVHNTGTAPLNITGVSFGGANPTSFAKTTDTCNGQTVAAGGTCVINVTFTASTSSPQTANLNVTDNAPGSPHSTALSGTALVPGISLTPAAATYAQTQIGVKSSVKTITVKNTGTAALKITSITLGGTAPTNFLKGSGTGDTCTGASIGVGKTCTFTVTFIPASAGSKTADVVIANNSGHTADLPLSGTGLVPPSPASMNVALGCDSSKITWTQPTGQIQWNGIKIIVNPSHAPTSPTDGTSLPHSAGYATQTGMTHYHTFYYAAYDVYSWYNDATKLIYSKPLQGSGHTGDICNPRNRGIISDLTMTANWLSYAPGAKYSVLLQQNGNTIDVVFPSTLSYTFPASWTYNGAKHSLQPNGNYFLYVYAYTATKPDGFLIGMAQFSETSGATAGGPM